jgi:hypothetical protein
MVKLGSLIRSARPPSDFDSGEQGGSGERFRELDRPKSGEGTYCPLTHMVGHVRYASKDGSKNRVILSILCCGEGWHNNLHHYQSAVNQGWLWWEVDASYCVLSVPSWFGLVWDLRTPPEHIKARTIAVEREQRMATPRQLSSPGRTPTR